MSTPSSALSIWANNVSPSPTLAVDAKAKAMKAAGEDVCGFGAGEPDFDTPDFIKEACIQALKEGKTKYIPAPGLPALREAVAQKHIQENKIQGLEASQVVISPGGKYSCYLAILATCSPGDEVIIPAPYWVSYPEMVKLAGAEPRVVFAGDDTGFKITPEQLQEAISPKTKVLMLNSPSNPTGAVYTSEELEALAQVALKNDLWIFTDEIYEYLLYDGAKHCSIASLSEEIAQRTITINGFSKAYSMTGWRLGTLVAPAALAKAVSSLQSHTTSNATTFAQYGALAALEQKDKAAEAIKKMRTVFDQRRALLFEGLSRISGLDCFKSQGAFYLFPKIKNYGLSSTDFAAQLLEQQKVAVVPGIAFGADDYIRLSYATSEETITKGLNRLKQFCETLN